MSDVGIEFSMLRINVSEGDYRHVFGSRICNAQGKPVRKDAKALRTIRGEQALFYPEALDKVSAFVFRGLEIVFLRMTEDEVERQEPGLDVKEFVLPAIP
jgi:hypothetical protein